MPGIVLGTTFMEVKARLQRVTELLVWRKQNLEGKKKRKAESLIEKCNRKEMILGCGENKP